MPKVDKREAKRTLKNCGGEEIVEQKDSPTQASTSFFNEEFAPGKRVSYTSYNGRNLVHVREFMNIGERPYPTKKGACFTPARLKVLMGKFLELDDELEQQSSNASYRSHLGGGVFASVKHPLNGIDLRRFWRPDALEDEIPTRSGIFIPQSQWPSLKMKLTELLATSPELSLAEECFHANQQGMMECSECSPFDWNTSRN
jgi:hypothetical protein